MAKGKAGKALKITLIVLLALIVLIGGGGYSYYLFITGSPQPQVDGQLKAAGLKDRVEVLRDASGTPHIYARNMLDLNFAQGYVQAQDRWWQMEFFRKTCGGRIEELTGKKAALVNTDIYLRSLGLYRVVEQEYNSYPADDRANLDAFAAGVNAYISGRSPQQLSVNYSILGLTGVKFKVDPWSPLDSLAFAKLMAWDLGLSRDLEMTRARLYDRLGAEMAEKWLVPPWPLGLKPTILLDEDLKATYTATLSASVSETDGGLLLRELLAMTCNDNPGSGLPVSELPAMTPDTYDPAADLALILGQTEGTGSNSWVATGSLTQGGKPLLANDPHLGIQQPSIWYEVNLHCADDGTGRPFDVAGFGFAANPGVVVGHNNDIAWGTTNVYPDVNDQYQIKVNQANPLQYEWNGKWRDMNVREETISFGDGKPPVAIKVRVTHLGPITNDNRYDAKTGDLSGFNNKDPLALHWTGLEPCTLARAITGLDRARNWDEFRAALQYWDTPSQSVVYADRQGNIGYQMPGRIPIRARNHTGQVPVPGWTDEYEWKGYVPFDLMPRVYNPARNHIVACNQEVAPPEYFAMLNKQLGPDVNAHFGSKYNKWVYGYRSQRAYELLKQLAPNTVTTFEAIQGDGKSIPASEILPALAGLKFSSQEVSDARDWLLKWDYSCSEDSPQAALFNEFIMRMLQNVFQGKLEGIAKSEGADKELWAITLLLKEPNDAWWDNPATRDSKETRDEILVKSFEEGYAATVAALGKDRSQWKWGTLHRAIFVSNPLGASGIGPIESLVNQGPVPAGGNNECLNNNHWYASKGNFNIGMIPSMRMIIDLGDFDKSVTMNSTGVSGHPGSRWYGDQVVPWARVKYHPMPWSRQQVESATKHKLVLVP
jgi:penicillin amidase